MTADDRARLRERLVRNSTHPDGPNGICGMAARDFADTVALLDTAEKRADEAERERAEVFATFTMHADQLADNAATIAAQAERLVAAEELAEATQVWLEDGRTGISYYDHKYEDDIEAALRAFRSSVSEEPKPR